MRFLAAPLVAAVLLIGAVDAGFCSFTLHVPQRDPGPLPRAYQNVSITARDGAKLEGWFVAPEKQTGRCVMILHGIGDTRQGASGFAPMFLDAGYSVLMADSRAHGRSGGELVTYGLLEKYDVEAWAAWSRAMGCAKLYGLGESLGAAILIQAAALTQDFQAPLFQAIVAESAYSDLRSIARYRVHQITHLPEWIGGPLILETSFVYARLRYGMDLSSVSPLDSLRHAHTPILLIHGLNDGRTPYWHSQVLATADPHAQLWLVPGADHTAAASTAPEEFRRRVLGWFGEN